jgi:hypothetical protein
MQVYTILLEKNCLYNQKYSVTSKQGTPRMCTGLNDDRVPWLALLEH